MSLPIVFVEGGIGCGKSTLVKHLQSYCEKNAKTYLTIQEPVDIWMTIQDKTTGKNMIEAFYQDQHKHGFEFQMMAYISRLQRLQEACKEALEKQCDFIICERSLYTDRNVFCKMLYDEGKINTYGYQIYNKWFEHFQSFLGDMKFVYLQTNYEVCLQRIKKRCRDGEENIPSEYLKKNNEYHDAWLMNQDDVLILNGNQDYDEKEGLLDEYCGYIMDLMKP
jgi:deoxyadenosine/deoxycytidine kinase